MLGRKILNYIAELITRHWAGILICTIILSFVAGSCAWKIGLDTDIMHLLPSNNRMANDFYEAADVFDFNNNLIVIINKNTEYDNDQTERFMDLFAEELKGSDLIRKVDHKLPNISFDKNAGNLTDRFNIDYTRYQSPGKEVFLMFIFPVEPSGNVRSAAKIMEEVRSIEKDLQQGNPEFADLDVKYTGGYAITLEEARNMERNVKITVIVSFICILLLFALIFRNLEIILFISIPLIMAILWTVAAAFFAIGSLNMLTVAFAAILAGLGVDFGIHLYNRYLFEISSGKDIMDAVRNTVRTTGESIFFSCLTTSLAFYSLTFTDFRGASQFGLLIGTGVIACMLTMVFVLPSLFILKQKLTKRTYARTNLFDLGFLAELIKKHGRWITIFCCAAAVIYGIWSLSTYGLPQFDNSLETMSSKENKAVEIQKDLLSRTGNCYEPVMIFSENKDPDVNVKMMKKLTPRVQAMKQSGIITRYESIFKYVPSSLDKTRFVEKAPSKQEAERGMDLLLKKMKNDPSKQEEYDLLFEKKDDILLLMTSENTSGDVSYTELKHFLPEILFSKFFVETKDGDYYSVLYVYPEKRIVTNDEIESLKTSLDIKNNDGIKLTSVSFMLGALENMIKQEVRNIMLVIGIALLIVLFVIYRNPALVVISLIPLLIGIFITLSVMATWDIKLNYMNIIAFPLILGMGIDDSIHMIHRYLENGCKDTGIMIRQTGRAVLLTSLTTMIGFGSLALSKHNGLISLGIITVVGISACLAASLMVLPGLLMMLNRGK